MHMEEPTEMTDALQEMCKFVEADTDLFGVL